MVKSVWDLCYLDSEFLAQIESINSISTNKSSCNSLKASPEVTEKIGVGAISSICNLQDSITEAENACTNSLILLDNILTVLNDVSSAYSDVTGRTNNLMINCETLLEQQHTYQQTVEILQATLEPFNDIEEVATILGIPFDIQPHHLKVTVSSDNINNASSSQVANAMLDPRSPEFKIVMNRIAKAVVFLATHHDIMDANKYRLWLEKLLGRVTALIGRAMREMIEKAHKTCADISQQKLYSGKSSTTSSLTSGNHTSSISNSHNLIGSRQTMVMDDSPLESAAVYQKFRGLGYRLRELSSLLLQGDFAEALAIHNNNINARNGISYAVSKSDHQSFFRNGKKQKNNYRFHANTVNGKHDGGTTSIHLCPDVEVLTEVKACYVAVRNELLLPFIKDAWLTGLLLAGASTGGSGHLLMGSSSSNSSESNMQQQSLSPSSSLDILSSSTTTTIHPPNSAATVFSLCSGIRHVYSTLLRITQLEQQLFESLFHLQNSVHISSSLSTVQQVQLQRATSTDTDGGSNSSIISNNTGSTVYSDATIPADTTAVVSIIETLANATRDFLRPFIIRESSVDELCRVVSALSEDVRSQMLAMPVPAPLLKQLLRGLDGTVNDAKERLSYCAESTVRQKVQLFEPLPSHLAYPDIIEEYNNKASISTSSSIQQQQSTYSLHLSPHQRAGGSNNDLTVISLADGNSSTVSFSVTGDGNEDYQHINSNSVYITWYPPMRQALSLLSKLYGIIESNVFEDFARRTVHMTVHALTVGAEGVRRCRPGIHGDLFLVRHLLILREQLVPFELKLQGTEKKLDFTTTAEALTMLLQNAATMWRMDQGNGFVQLALSGLPRMQETQIDAKKELDTVLKTACFSLKHTAVKLLLGDITSLLAKVAAFVGEIHAINGSCNSTEDGMPSSSNSSEKVGAVVPIISKIDRDRLNKQSFLRPDRIKETLESVQNSLTQRVPDLKAVMKLYIENSVARTILLKPIWQDFETAKKKLDWIIGNCLEPGSIRRDLEHLLQTISMTVQTDLLAR